MSIVLSSEPLLIWVFILTVGLLAGLVKGTVGFAMPMILISGLGTVMTPEIALAGLILPTLTTNLWQALRHGIGAAWSAAKRFRVFLLCGGVVMLLSAQLVTSLPPGLMFLLIGIPISLYAMSGLMGRPLRLPRHPSARAEAAIGAVAGFFGGIAGVWGPPTVAMLTAQDVEKTEHVQIQGVIYGLGAVALLGAHVGSGVLRAETLPLSLIMVVPAMLGMAVGVRIHDRIDQASFRKLTLAVLLIAALNLVRRGLGY